MAYVRFSEILLCDLSSLIFSKTDPTCFSNIYSAGLALCKSMSATKGPLVFILPTEAFRALIGLENASETAVAS